MLGPIPAAGRYRPCRMGRLSLENRWPRPTVMGIVNVTPDSFSDGGALHWRPRRRSQVPRDARRGSGLVDVGGESTRPGAPTVPLDEELRRVLPVVEQLAGLDVSVDTTKAEVARRALAAGARDGQRRHGAAWRSRAGRRRRRLRRVPLPDAHAGHAADDAGRRRDTTTSSPRSSAFLEERLAVRGRGGHRPRSRICVDPGIGFGKTADQNLALLRGLRSLVGARTARCSSASRARARWQGHGGPEARVAIGRRLGRSRGRRVRARRERCSGCTTWASTSRRSRSRRRSSAVR